jgi:hypothetical protein
VILKYLPDTIAKKNKDELKEAFIIFVGGEISVKTNHSK